MYICLYAVVMRVFVNGERQCSPPIYNSCKQVTGFGRGLEGCLEAGAARESGIFGVILVDVLRFFRCWFVVKLESLTRIVYYFGNV